MQPQLVSKNQFKVMYMIDKQYNTPTQLAEVFHRSLSCVVTDLTTLNKKGLVEKTKDGKTALYYLTHEGRGAKDFYIMWGKHAEALIEFCKGLDRK